ncbi:hypothetical protein S7711_07006 [Stachybotrys chartarum IBT 7711]|uniref:C2H2-type domain-containing protein n=1 Tax=Stachybotrys chartarum (strain CBS 109288 / IBT 7711) TaxID=1280523 RepID=A0A084AYC9_STACB|nr:hypothetical protein S7711_07006 [Stachybotrys chartarum IBT 7711]
MSFQTFPFELGSSSIPGCGSLYSQARAPRSMQPHHLDALIDPGLHNNAAPSLVLPEDAAFLQVQNFGGNESAMALHPQHGAEFHHLFHGAGPRHSSPSSQPFSSNSSSAQSPPTESDCCYDGMNAPLTPPEFMQMPPFTLSLPYDKCEDFPSQPLSIDRSAFYDNNCLDPSRIASISYSSNEAQGDGANIGYQEDIHFDHHVSHSPDDAIFNMVGHTQRIYPQSTSSDDQFYYHAPPNRTVVGERAQKTEETCAAAKEAPTQQMPSDKKYPRKTRSSGKFRKPKGITKRASVSPETATRSQRSTFLTSDPPPRLLSASFKHCGQCAQTFKDESALQKHVKKEHTRPFVCVFHYAGCASVFATKNEWKRHVASQHLALTYWLCTYDNCAQTKGPATQNRSTDLPSFGSIFNRKDLFTQHVRRMHQHEPKGVRSKEQTPEKNERLRLMQEGALHERCQLPQYMKCPVQLCSVDFHGAGAWDERMEHCARHLEAAATGQEGPVQFGGDHDMTLTDWAEMKGVNVVKRTQTGWELCNPLKGIDMAKLNVGGLPESDAEGEDF